MANYDASDLLTKILHMGSGGDCNSIKGKVTPSGFTTSDLLRPLRIPAGTEVHAVILANDDLDSNGTPTAAFKAGYAPVSSADGALAASDAYFVPTGTTQFQAASQGVVYNKFDPIKFEQDVYLTITPSANAATFAAGSVWATVLGRAVGVK